MMLWIAVWPRLRVPLPKWWGSVFGRSPPSSHDVSVEDTNSMEPENKKQSLVHAKGTLAAPSAVSTRSERIDPRADRIRLIKRAIDVVISAEDDVDRKHRWAAATDDKYWKGKRLKEAEELQAVVLEALSALRRYG